MEKVKNNNRKFRTITEAYPVILKDLIEDGVRVESRGMEVMEIMNYSFTIENPHFPLVMQESRNLNYAYAVLEPFLLTMPQTYEVIAACEFYVGKFLNKHVIGETGKMFGWYGDRMNHNGRNQLLEVYRILKEDAGSRRAVITMHNSSEELFSGHSIDTPCTLEVQFMIRNMSLECFVNMRGNDAMLGTPQNVAMWTFFQRMIARWLGVACGSYHHRVNSMHLYTRDLEKAKAIVKSGAREMTDPEAILFFQDWRIQDPIESLRMCEKFAITEGEFRRNGYSVAYCKLPKDLQELMDSFVAPQMAKIRKRKGLIATGNPYATIDS